jgi:tRNA pseudouridine55 synthase
MTDCANCPKSQTQAKSRWVAPKRAVPLSGILNVDKPPGMTSHDVIDVVRRMVGQRKVGHAGTLDPMATGVLLVCLGKATRVAEYLMQGRKRYRATVVLGTTTDTYDADGEVVSSGGQADFTRDEIGAALARFVGPIEQVPPMYSAIKQEGQPLYKLARQGKTVERSPRPVEIDAIELLDWTSPALSIEVDCSPGTYVRSLAHDLGEALGSGAYLSALVRLSSGRFTLEDATSLDRLAEAFEHDQGDRHLLALDEAFFDRPAAVVGAGTAQRIVHGQAVALDTATGPGEGGAELVRVYGPDGDFVAIVTYDAASGMWRPKKVFA